MKNVSPSNCHTQFFRVGAIDYGLRENISEKNLQMLLDICQNTEVIDVIGLCTDYENVFELSCHLNSIHR